MVRVYFPQKTSGNLDTNSNYPPQTESSIEKPPLGTGFWIADDSDDFVDDQGNRFVFTLP